MERSITDEELDATASRLVQGFHEDRSEFEPDLCVDGLSESIFTRLLNRFSGGNHT